MKSIQECLSKQFCGWLKLIGMTYSTPSNNLERSRWLDPTGLIKQPDFMRLVLIYPDYTNILHSWFHLNFICKIFFKTLKENTAVVENRISGNEYSGTLASTSSVSPTRSGSNLILLSIQVNCSSGIKTKKSVFDRRQNKSGLDLFQTGLWTCGFRI